MKTILFSIISVLSLQFSLAQNATEDILTQVKDKLFTQTLTQFEFNLAIVNFEANFHKEKDGTLTAGDNKYILELPDDETSIYFDGKTRWSIFSEDEEIQISNVEEDEADLSFSKYFEDYKGNYDYKEGQAIAKGETQILLTPKDKESDTKLIELNIKMEDFSIASISEHGTNGTIRTIKVTSFKALENGSVNFAPNMETFKDFEIIDMR